MGNRYQVSDFDYEYPESAVAQRPLPDRDASRLLVLDRRTGAVRHRSFAEFVDLPEPGDVLVLNASRVVPARLTGRRANGRPAEVLLVHPDADDTWLAMVHPGGKLKPGRQVQLDGEVAIEIVDIVGGGLRRVRFLGPLTAVEAMDRYGAVPLPPYIGRQPDAMDRERYQTVFARAAGSVAAPTAGLHFTPALLERLVERHVSLAEIVLHVGPGTFRPIDAARPEDHVMHAEWYSLPQDAAHKIAAARAGGHRIWAIGTTSARVLETVGAEGLRDAQSGWTDLFIFPPHEFTVVDALLTNFHLPQSTLLMLVAAFAGVESTLAAYREAVRAGYRLFSYGDAMAVV